MSPMSSAARQANNKSLKTRMPRKTEKVAKKPAKAKAKK